MKNLYIRAESNVIDKILEMINQFSHEGEEIEILDNLVFETERKLIRKALLEVREGRTYSHEEVWEDLLN